MTSYIYLSSPYSHPDATMRENRYLATAFMVGHLSARGKVVFSPIVHYHPAALMHQLPGDAEYWKKVNSTFLQAAAELKVLLLPGWDVSVGVSWELEMAAALQLPVSYMSVPPELVEQYALKPY